MWKKKRTITLINTKWEIIKPNIKVKYIPRWKELIYLEEADQYYQVVNVIYYLNNNEGVWVVVDKHTPQVESNISFSG